MDGQHCSHALRVCERPDGGYAECDGSRVVLQAQHGMDAAGRHEGGRSVVLPSRTSPEGFAVSMPLRRQGMSRKKSFFYGQLSAIVEPVFGVLGAWAVMTFEPILPYALAFAAGAMIFVVVEEVIPESQRGKNTDLATLGFMVGFVVMMTLDVALG